LALFARIWIDRSLPGRVDPSDLVQETLLKAHQRFGQFRGMTEPELASWLRQILARTVADLVRRHGAAARQLTRQQSLEAMADGSALAIDGLMAASGTSPSEAAERRELGVLLADALAELSPDHREVILLRNLQELDWEQVAAKMGRSADAVRMLWARALKKLRPIIEARL
jgi:RNA polymerase sigma-70 factor (ECF subfamily)